MALKLWNVLLILNAGFLSISRGELSRIACLFVYGDQSSNHSIQTFKECFCRSLKYLKRNNIENDL